MVSPLRTLSRRSFVATGVAMGALPARLMAQPPRPIIAGTYTKEGGPGLVRLDAGTKALTAAQTWPAIANASFGVQGSAGMRYLVDEQPQGGVGIYNRDLRLLAAFPSLGADPCHIALNAEGSALAVANYSSGSVTLWRLDRTTGLPLGEGHKIVHEGTGPNRERQAEPHAHWVGFAAGGTLLHAVDLGADAIFAHRIDPRSGAVNETRIAYRAEAGSGPRHLARHPKLPIAFLVCELSNSVTILQSRPDGTFSARGTVSTLPGGFTGPSQAAHIALNRAGDRLYISNRGHDSIAVFAIGSDGALTLIQHAACGGHWPRMFLLLEDEGEMLVANERSGNIARLEIGKDGRLTAGSAGVSLAGVAYLSI